MNPFEVLNYENHSTNVGLDRCLRNIATRLMQKVSWLELSFGRAFDHVEKASVGDGERFYTIPKVYTGKGEYFPVTPNDFRKSYSFFKVSPAQRSTWAPGRGKSVPFERQVSLIVWVNFKELTVAGKIDCPYYDILEADVVKALVSSNEVRAIGEVCEETISLVYQGYEFPVGQLRGSSANLQFVQYPFGAFRVDFTVNYFSNENIC